MSWWDSSGLTSFASQALKNAQKKIDKVLDIQNDAAPDTATNKGDQKESPRTTPQNPAAKDEDDNFFNSWFNADAPQSTTLNVTTKRSPEASPVSRNNAPAKTDLESEVKKPDTAKSEILQCSGDASSKQAAPLEEAAQAHERKSGPLRLGSKQVTRKSQGEESEPSSPTEADVKSNTDQEINLPETGSESHQQSLEDVFTPAVEDTETVVKEEVCDEKPFTEGTAEQEQLKKTGTEAEDSFDTSEKPETIDHVETASVDMIEGNKSIDDAQFASESDDNTSKKEGHELIEPVETGVKDSSERVHVGYAMHDIPSELHKSLEPVHGTLAHVIGVNDDIPDKSSLDKISESTVTVQESYTKEDLGESENFSEVCDFESPVVENIDGDDSKTDNETVVAKEQDKSLVTSTVSDLDMEVIDRGDTGLKDGCDMNMSYDSSTGGIEKFDSDISLVSHDTQSGDSLSDSNRTLTGEDLQRVASTGDTTTCILGNVDVTETPTQDCDINPKEPETEIDDSSLTQKEPSDTVETDNTAKDDNVTLSTSASFVKCMLEEAMVESVKDSDSYSSSDMVRVGSGHNSGQTSGDEIDTTTSSDIEIISAPSNGEYRVERPFDLSPIRHALSKSMVQRRISPPGHKRSDSGSNGEELVSPDELFKARSLGDHGSRQEDKETATSPQEQSPTDSQRLLKKLAEMAEILQVREKKLLALSHENMDLVETNNIIRNQLKHSEEAREAEMLDLNELTEEFTKRIADSEKKLQNGLREKEALKKQLKHLETEIVKKSQNVATEQMIKEKDQQIEDLLKEGEKLSKQQLQNSNIIKKLRAKEKESDSLCKSQKEKIDELKKEVDRLTKILDAKEEIEQKQTAAINQLNNALKKQETEISGYKSELEDANEKVRSMQVGLDNSYKEIAELHKKNVVKASEAQSAALSVEVHAKEELRLCLERQQQQSRLEHEAYINQIEDLQLSLSRMEREHGRREDVLRQEISDLHQRLQEAEDRNQDLTQGVTAATRPLLRQIENLQSAHSAQAATYEKVERNLTERLSEAQRQLAEALEKERQTNEQMMDSSVRVTSLEAQVSSLRHEKSRLTAQLETTRAKLELLEESRSNETARFDMVKHELEAKLSETKKEKLLVENQLEMEKMRTEAEKKKLASIMEQLHDKEIQVQQLQIASSMTGSMVASMSGSMLNSMTTSQTLTRRDSVHSETSLNASMHDDMLEKTLMMTSPNGSKTSLYESLRQSGAAASIIENLQAQVKQREGEIAQLQSDIQELEHTREAMARELVNLTTMNTDLETKLMSYPMFQEKYKDLDQRYNALLQMYGEKVEETEELKMDLHDVKDMYKAQIDHLLKQ